MTGSIRTLAVSAFAITVELAGALAMSARPAAAQGAPAPGTSTFGRASYIEYIVGDLPLIFSAPHGGTLAPSEIPDRTEANCAGDDRFVTGADSYTQPLTRAILTAFYNRTGKYPHVIINRLGRQKLDANRDINQGACTDPEARLAWNEYHEFIQEAKDRVLADHGRGWYTDVHGHNHAASRLEIGTLLTGSELRMSNATLDGSAAYEMKSSFATFSQLSPLSFATLLRGPTGLGTLLANAGYPSVPSAQDPAPAVGQGYFNGGYNTVEHGCAGGGSICGIQIEHHYQGVRDTAANRATYAAALASVYDRFLAQNFGLSLISPVGETIADDDNGNNDLTRAHFIPTASWTTAPSAPTQHLNSYHVATGAGPTSDGSAFAFYVSSAGTYSVYAWWAADSTRTQSASYRVFEIEGGKLLQDVRLSQRANGGKWNLLGTWAFTKVGWAKVLMSRSLSASGTICADAIRAVRQ